MKRPGRAKRAVSRSSFKTAFCRVGALAAVAGLASCHEIDTTRIAPFKATLGDDLYGVLCDRLGASSLTEDQSGESYEGICHPKADGSYANEVDESILPPPSGDGVKARERSLAKMRAMARWRTDLIRAFNSLFPDIEIDNVTTEAEGDKVRLHDGLFKFGQALSPLYESNPYEAEGEPLFPSSTRALSRALNAIASSDEAKAAMSRIWGRRGYRPFKAGLGAVRSALAYPNLRDFTKASLGVLGPKGSAGPQLQALFRAAKHDLASAQAKDSVLAPFRILDVNKAQPERPRTTLEFTAGLFLQQDNAFSNGAGPAWNIAMRDRRGFVVPEGNIPGQVGSVPSPFGDANSDGFADVDPFGRFLDGSGSPLTLDPPFSIPGIAAGNDSLGPYEYIDTARTSIAAVTRSLRTLADPENGALMDALAGARVLLGPRTQAKYDFTKDGKDAILSMEQPCPTVPADACIEYTRFKGEESPLVDLLYAAGPILADPDSDVLLLGLLDLIENHEDAVARLLGAALKLRQIALDHDALAAQNKEPFAAMPYEAPMWDQMAQVLSVIAEKPGLTQDLVKSFADPAVTTPHGTSKHLGDTLSVFMKMRDELTYNPQNLNGPALNLTVDPNGGSTVDPQSPVDQTKPKTGKNRSIFERTLQVIHDVNGVPACNKSNAYVEANTGGDPGTCPQAASGGCDLHDDGIGLSWPLVGSGYDECELFRFENLAGFFLDSVLPPNHPRRSKMELKGDTINAIMDFLGGFVSKDDLFQKSSGICGLTEKPEPYALARLVFFQAQSGLYPNIDTDPLLGGKNAKTNLFISSLMEPVGTVACPVQPNGVRICNNETGTLRERGINTLFTWERLGFFDYLRPVVVPFANVPCNNPNGCAPFHGEQLFVDLVEALYQHWGTSGGNTYEPILVDAFKTDLIPALADFSKISAELSKVTVARGPKSGEVWTGADVLAKTLQILFSQPYSSQRGLTDRKGNKATKWNDGTAQAQVTPFSMFADALHGLDVRFDTACNDPDVTDKAACETDAAARKAQWKAARSLLVDEFLTIDGEGKNGAKFRNKAVPKILATTLKLLREQINGHCPDRETTGKCDWASKELPDKLATTISGPVFAGLMDVQEALRADEAARLETQRLLVHILSSDADPESYQSALSSFADVVQVLQADGELAPILRALAPSVAPKDDPNGAGAGDSMLAVLQALVDDQYDPYHVMDYVLPAAVTPMDDGSNRAPLEIFIDAIADIHRIDAETESSDSPLETTDYGTIFTSVSQFLTSETRGLEQFYFIVQNRPRE
ncbi:MAG: hypothetical protein IPK82_24340 [Polyangiaceae bacterium]|nr:hypothetical protein [Polyangiaceae bacterium]